MPTAFVLINYEFGAEKETINKLKTVPGVIETSEVNGVYDIIIKITSNNLGNLKDTIRRRIRTIDTIRSTMTLVAVEYKSQDSQEDEMNTINQDYHHNMYSSQLCQ